MILGHLTFLSIIGILSAMYKIKGLAWNGLKYHGRTVFVIPSCEKYKNSALYHGAISWNMLPVNIRNIDSFDSFKAHQKKAMKENG